MGEVFSFGAEERASLLETLSRRERPAWLRIVLHGDARALSGEVGLRVWQGRIVEATPAGLSVPRVLLRMAFARAGRVEVRADEGPEPDLRTALPIRRALTDAEQTARALEALLAPLGGPTVVVVTRPDRVVKAAAQIGRTALEIANLLLDRPRSVGEVLTRGTDDLATARALDQLRDLGVLELEGESAASTGSLAPPPSTTASGRPGVRSRPPTMRSRAPARPRLLEVPEPADDDEPELERALSDSPRVRLGSSRPARPAGAEVPSAPADASSARTDEVPASVLREGRARSVEPPPEAPSRALVERGSSPEAEVPQAAPRPLPARSAVAPPVDDFDPEPPRSSALPWLIGMAVVILLLLAVWLLGREPAPPPAPPVAVVDPTPIPTPPPTPPPPPRTASVAPSAYSLSRPPPLAGPEADRRLREAERLIQAGRYEEAEAILAPLRVSRAEDPLVWLLTGTLEIERGRFGDASSAIDRAITIDPKSYRGYILRGSLQQFQGSARAAVQSYRAALAISPAHPMSPELREVTERLQADVD